MTVKRIVSDVAADDTAAARRFYHDVLGLVLRVHRFYLRGPFGKLASLLAQVGGSS